MIYEPPPHYSDFDLAGMPIWKKWLAGFWRHTEESGTWTPEYSSSGTAPSSITYEDQEGVWIRRGSVLHAWWQTGTDALTVGTGNFHLAGLPFANAAGFSVDGLVRAFNFVGADGTYNSARPTNCRIADGTAYIQFDQADNTTVDATETYLETGANSNRMRGYIAYPVEV